MNLLENVINQAKDEFAKKYLTRLCYPIIERIDGDMVYLVVSYNEDWIPVVYP